MTSGLRHQPLVFDPRHESHLIVSAMIVGHEIVAEHARLLACGLDGEAAQQREKGGHVFAAFAGAAVKNVFDHAALQPRHAAGLADENALAQGAMASRKAE